MPPFRERACLILIRVWFESDEDERFRARVTVVPDLESAAVEVLATAHPEEVLRIVERSLAGVAERSIHE